MTPKLFMETMAGQKKMPEAAQSGTPSSAQSDQAAILGKVKRAELEAKSRVEEARSQAERTRSEAKAESDGLLKQAESEAAKLSADLIQAGREETEKELEVIRAEAAKEAAKTREHKGKVRMKEIIDSVLGV